MASSADSETGRAQDLANRFYAKYGKSIIMSAQMLEVSLLGVGTVLRLERNAWSTVKRLRQAANDHGPPPLG